MIRLVGIHIFMAFFACRTVSLLTDLMKNKETAEIFKERQLALKHNLPLGSYLLKPVQRILKYHLLLQVNIWVN